MLFIFKYSNFFIKIIKSKKVLEELNSFKVGNKRKQKKEKNKMIVNDRL